MARREGEEISAGSMADIAFLLLIFFIVTTTMDLEAGIPQTLMMDIPPPPDYKPDPVKDRDLFSIAVNDNDQLLIENEWHEVEDIRDMFLEYFTANELSETNPEMARYENYTIPICEAKLQEKRAELATDTTSLLFISSVKKWEKRLKVCNAMPSKTYRTIHPTAIVQLRQKSKSSYGNYIAIKNILKTVIYELRDKKCKELYSGLSYFDLDLTLEADMERETILRILVPERILEPKIKN